MQFTQLLQKIEELETILQESNKEIREKYYVLLDKLTTELEEKIRKRDY